MMNYIPTSASLAFRVDLAHRVSTLRPVRIRVPFFKLAAHTVPTRWSLYRSLLRDSPSEHIRLRVKEQFRKHKSLTSPQQTVEQLRKGYKWLDIFKQAQQGDEHVKARLRRYERALAKEHHKRKWKAIYANELKWIERLRRRPIVKTSIMKATLFNPPLPRLSPQPEALSMMIRKRRRKREPRVRRIEQVQEWRRDIERESAFEAALIPTKSKQVFGHGSLQEWTQPINDTYNRLQSAFERDTARLNAPVSDDLRDIIKAARTERARNKKSERERELRGEVTNRVLKRLRQGPPAHVLRTMSKERRELDHILRGPSEGGWMGRTKRRAGMKLHRELRDEGWVEESSRARVKQIYREIAEEQERRMQAAHSDT